MIKKVILAVLIMFTYAKIVGQDNSSITTKLFVYGGQLNKQFLKYTAELTGKEKPKIIFLPTATGDSDRYINYWYELCSDLDIEPHVLRVWINSYRQKESFENVLLKMDAIIVGGGNTLNMLAIWKAQEIDQALKKAYKKGIILAGGSAGSLCWFNGGTTDSRPKELSIVKGLSFLDYSHCPHYHSEESRRPLYHKNILTGKLGDGYACDDNAGILFINDKVKEAVTLDEQSNSYFVYKNNGKIEEEKIEAKILK
ncbi:peptidase E [Aquimarina sp. D1M17]|uniref:Type 1 glutamine amidotransferase-like domain-containing protein n=1 Tax=Aquimarina acroporae TaxID=2937283 RepID=UPI0020BEC77A|nr:peptidase E [Aquimarina acroporae]MCK8521991.1 peptidase E [Aquimarina acroporae]